MDIYPSVTQISPFMVCASIPTTVKMQAIHLASGRALNKGDQVIVVASPSAPSTVNLPQNDPIYAGSVGVVHEIILSFTYVSFDKLDYNTSETVQILTCFLRCYHKIGDYVRVKTSENKGLMDYIVNVNPDGDQITLYNSDMVSST